MCAIKRIWDIAPRLERGRERIEVCQGRITPLKHPKTISGTRSHHQPNGPEEKENWIEDEDRTRKPLDSRGAHRSAHLKMGVLASITATDTDLEVGGETRDTLE